jgi:hypothetical protein
MLRGVPKVYLHIVGEKNYPYTESDNTFPTLLTSFQIPALIYSPTHIDWSTLLCKDMNLATIRRAMCKNTTLKL